jgi:arsenical pump membrane protein
MDWFRLGLGLAIFVVTIVLIMTRPAWLPLKETGAALLGGILMLSLGFVGLGEAGGVLLGEWNAFLFFLGLMTIAAMAERAGFFDWVASLAARQAKGSSRRLFVNVFVIGTLITAFLSNDATALILTPIVYSIVVRLRLDALPYMFACTFIADTASFILPVSNPINILVTNRFPQPLSSFLLHLLPAALVVIAVNVLVFLFIFKNDLRERFDARLVQEPAAAIRNPVFFRYVCGVLALIAVCYVTASALQAPLSLVALGGAALLIGGAVALREMDWPKLAGEISWSIFGFIAAMFIVVRGVENLGVTQWFGNALVGLGGGGKLGTILANTAGAALGANLINNVPMAIVMNSAIGQAAAPPLQPALVYSTIFAADLGPNITTVGSLATILWLLILRRKGLEVSAMAYFKLGIIVTPLMLLLGALAIWLTLL